MDRLEKPRLTTGMSTSPFVILITASAIASAAVGGLLYAFSTFVMRGLDRLEPVEALTAMRGINTEANSNAPFLLMFFGSALLAIAVGVVTVIQWGRPGTSYLIAGAVFAVTAAIITVAFNVPLNNRLDAVDPGGLSAADAAREWRAYLGPWTVWNHVRCITALLGAALLVVGMRYR